MVYSMDYSKLLEKHLESGADITILYQNVDTAKDEFMNCNVLNLNKQKGVLSIERNRGTAKNRNISLDTYVMSKELFMELVKKAAKFSSMYTLRDIIDDECSELDIRGIAHHGYVAAISDFKSYYDANMRLIDYETAQDLFSPDCPKMCIRDRKDTGAHHEFDQICGNTADRTAERTAAITACGSRQRGKADFKDLADLNGKRAKQHIERDKHGAQDQHMDGAHRF